MPATAAVLSVRPATRPAMSERVRMVCSLCRGVVAMATMRTLACEALARRWTPWTSRPPRRRTLAPEPWGVIDGGREIGSAAGGPCESCDDEQAVQAAV